MAYILNEKIKKLVPYEPLMGNYPVRLDANESYLLLPQSVQTAVEDALCCVDFRRYPDPLALGCLKAYGNYLNVDVDCLTAGNGSDELISIILGGFFNKGDSLLVAEPDFSMYQFYAHNAELKVIVCKKDEDYQIDIKTFIKKAQVNQCRGVIFSNPCNPTAQGIKRQSVIEIIEALPEMLVIVDEAYMDFWDQSVSDLVETYDNLLVLRTCSKAFGSAAIRLGFALSCISNTKALRALKSPYNVNALTQAAGEAILSHPLCLTEAIKKIVVQKNTLHSMLVEFAKDPGNPYKIKRIMNSHTNFIVVITDEGQKMYEDLKEEGLLIRCFPSFVRITAGSPEEQKHLIEVLQRRR